MRGLFEIRIKLNKNRYLRLSKPHVCTEFSLNHVLEQHTNDRLQTTASDCPYYKDRPRLYSSSYTNPKSESFHLKNSKNMKRWNPAVWTGFSIMPRDASLPLFREYGLVIHRIIPSDARNFTSNCECQSQTTGVRRDLFISSMACICFSVSSPRLASLLLGLYP